MDFSIKLRKIGMMVLCIIILRGSQVISYKHIVFPSLSDCDFNGWGINDCDHGEAASIDCIGGSIISTLSFLPLTQFMSYLPFI